MAHSDEYHEAMIATLELVWGEGFMAPGGAGNVRRMVAGVELAGRRLLDIGCGLGAPALLLAGMGAQVTGIDLEAPLLRRAQAAARAQGLAERAAFRQVEAGPLPFADASFDVVFSSGAFTQIEDKAASFAEVHRVLKPAGAFTLYDWFKAPGPYSAAMREWFRLEGLTYAMMTMADYEALLRGAGFQSVTVADASPWYRRAVVEEHQRLKGPLYPRMKALIGREQADHFVENWRAMVAVCESGEMRQGYSRAYRPA